MYSSTQKFRSSLFKGLWGAGVKPLLGGLEGKALQQQKAAPSRQRGVTGVRETKYQNLLKR